MELKNVKMAQMKRIVGKVSNYLSLRRILCKSLNT